LGGGGSIVEEPERDEDGRGELKTEERVREGDLIAFSN